MSASSRGTRAAVPLLRRAGASQMCTRCATLSQRIPAASRRAAYSTSTTTTSDPNAPSPNVMPVTSSTTPPTDPTPVEQTHQHFSHPKSLYRIQAGVILSRPPILTRKQTPFESAFYLYQKRLNERLSTPFARQFYFRKGQPAAVDFAIKNSERGNVMAREIGKASRSGRDLWDDELLMDEGAKLADPDYVRERLYTEAESRVSEDGEALTFDDRLRIERPLPRETAAAEAEAEVEPKPEPEAEPEAEAGAGGEVETEANRTDGMRRLDRKLDRTLYLVVKNGKERWGFPQDDVRPDEGVYETAVRALESTAGVNMNTWIVGRHPVAYQHWEPTYQDDETAEGGRSLKRRGGNVFFLKGRIMAGQADLTDNGFDFVDFKWLTKDELKEQLQPALYQSVETALPSQ